MVSKKALDVVEENLHAEIRQAFYEITALRKDLNRIGAEVQKLLLIPGLHEVPEVPEKVTVVPKVPAHYKLRPK